jgi:hypothetical protein
LRCPSGLAQARILGENAHLRRGVLLLQQCGALHHRGVLSLRLARVLHLRFRPLLLLLLQHVVVSVLLLLLVLLVKLALLLLLLLVLVLLVKLVLLVLALLVLLLPLAMLLLLLAVRLPCPAHVVLDHGHAARREVRFELLQKPRLPA